jgi:hypothetical protein
MPRYARNVILYLCSAVVLCIESGVRSPALAQEFAVAFSNRIIHFVNVGNEPLGNLLAWPGLGEFHARNRMIEGRKPIPN